VEEMAWLKEYSSQGIAVIVSLFFLWMIRIGSRAAWKFITEQIWPAAKAHVDTVNATLGTLGTNEIRQTNLMESMNGQLTTHSAILDKHGQRLEEHGQMLHEIHQVVRKPVNGGG